jgi:hypothetical protein
MVAKMKGWLFGLGLAPTKQNFGFITTMTCILGMLALAWFKGVDINASLPVILGTYLGARAIEKGTAYTMASKDANCDTRGLINDLEHGQQPRGNQPESPE